MTIEWQFKLEQVNIHAAVPQHYITQVNKLNPVHYLTKFYTDSVKYFCKMMSIDQQFRKEHML